MLAAAALLRVELCDCIIVDHVLNRDFGAKLSKMFVVGSFAFF